MIMRNKFWGRIVSWLTILILIIGSVPVQGGNETDTVGEAYELMDGIVRYKISQSGAGNIQQWIDGALTKNAGATSEWYVLALGQSGEYNFTSYVKALKEYLNSHTVSSATSRQKYAIALAATGSTDSYISSVMEETIGEQGIMSWVYGLHLLNNGYVSSKETVATVKDKILSLQLADGGWAIMGTNGDSDVTSMVIQALAPYYNKDTEITVAVYKALTLLSSCQLEDGDYAGYGVANLESTAQVITALSSLGIDGEKDSRFIKNGNTLFDGLRKYQLTDGSFCHELDGGYNDNATVQVFYAMVSYTRMMEGKSGLYILDNCNPSGYESDSAETEILAETAGSMGGDETVSAEITDSAVLGSYKLWACLIIVLITGIVGLVLHFAKKFNKKNLMALLVVTTLAFCFVIFTDFKSTDDYYNGEDVTKENAIGKVTLTIRCDTVAGKTDSKYIPKDGIILERAEFVIDGDDTVYDILTEAARKYSIQMENSGAETMVYISGINYLYEFDFGELSGWIYHVNNESQSVGCDQYKLKDGDVIEWLYTCELGKDLE